MIFESPTIFKWTKDEKIALLFDNMGLSEHDKVVIPMKSGKTAVFRIESFKPMLNWSTVSHKQARIHKQLAWRATLRPLAYTK